MAKIFSLSIQERKDILLQVIFGGNGQKLESLLSNNPKFSAALHHIATDSTAMNAVINSSTAMNAVINSSTAMNAIANSSTAMNAIANSSTAMNAVINSSTAMNAVINSSTAMNAIANSSTAMNAVINSSTAMNAIANSSYLLNVASSMYNTCNNNADKFQKYTVSLNVNSSTPTYYWTSTAGATTTQPKVDANIVFVYQVVDNTGYANTVNLYHLIAPGTVAKSVDLPATSVEVVNLSPYQPLFGGIKAYDAMQQGSANKTVYFYGFKAL